MTVRRRSRAVFDEGARAGYIALGFLFLVLGVIGAFLPAMPTTVFMIGAAWAFGRSSPRLERWILGHPRFGPPLTAWRSHGAISRRAKFAACGGKIFGYGLFLVIAGPSLPIALVVFALMAGIAIWIVLRSEPVALPIVGPETQDLIHPAVFERPGICGMTTGGMPCD